MNIVVLCRRRAGAKPPLNAPLGIDGLSKEVARSDMRVQVLTLNQRVRVLGPESVLRAIVQ